MTAGGTVRVATTRDGPVLAAIHLRSFRHAYRDSLPAGILEGLEVGTFRLWWEERLALPAGDDHFVLAAADPTGNLVGVASAGGSRDVDGKGDGEIYVLYVAPDRLGEGYGKTLVAAVVGSLEEAGFRRATLWVAASNVAARGFYDHLGWLPDGAEKTMTFEGEDLVEIRYCRTLSEGSTRGTSFGTSGGRSVGA